MVVDNFKIYKSKWYIVAINKQNNKIRHIQGCCSSKRTAYNLVTTLDAADLKLYNDFIDNRYIVKGCDVSTWFYTLKNEVEKWRMTSSK